MLAALLLTTAVPQASVPVRAVAVARARIVSAARISIGRPDPQRRGSRPGLIEFQ